MAEYAVTDPATGDRIRTYPEFTDAAVAETLDSAARVHRDWIPSTTPASRAELLRNVARLHRERREELAELIVTEMGKIRDGALGEVDFAADIIDYYADHAEAIMRDQPIEIQGEGSAVIRRASLGPLLGIMPWNFPYYQVARFAAPNLLVGIPSS